MKGYIMKNYTKQFNIIYNAVMGGLVIDLVRSVIFHMHTDLTLFIVAILLFVLEKTAE